MQQEDVKNLVEWSEPQEVNTRRGKQLLSTAEPTPEFWTAWRSNKEELKSNGVTCSKDDSTGEWECRWWQPLTSTSQPEEYRWKRPSRSDLPSANSGEAVRQNDENCASIAHEPESTGRHDLEAAVTSANQNRTLSPEIEVKSQSTTLAAAGTLPPASTFVRTWSEEQKAIFTWFVLSELPGGKRSKNLVVRARAGTGKTTTVKEAFTKAPEQDMLYVVFNKRNQVEAEAKITDSRVDVKTLHALGFSYIQDVWSGSRPEAQVERDRIEQVAGKDIPDPVAAALGKLVGFAKNTSLNPSLLDLIDICELKWIECPGFELEEDGGWTAPKLAEYALKVLEVSKVRDPQHRISFNDMVWLPVVMRWVKPRYSLVAVDEAQDMNLLQLKMAEGACKPNGRICVIGDDRQAIYGFRGAVSNGIDMMKDSLSAAELGLTTTYRCPKLVVNMAAETVPDYKSASEAPDGIVEYLQEYLMLNQLHVGDAVLSRTNAPLMPICLQLLRKGVAARIEGKDTGRELVGFVRRLKARSVPDFIRRVESWADKQIKRAMASKYHEEKIALINDKVDTLIAVAEGCAGVNEVEDRLTSIFQDSDQRVKPAVVFSTVHKAKGLEWDKVWIMKRTFQRKQAKPGAKIVFDSREEANVWYVAITRTKQHLVIVE